MLRTSLTVCGAVVILSVALAGAAFAHVTTTPKLHGTVGPGFTIALAKSGQKVTVLKAGSYLFVIADKSPIHNFTLQRLSGGAFTKQLTSTPFQGTKSITLKLGKGKWEYFCSIHKTTMHALFSVS